MILQQSVAFFASWFTGYNLLAVALAVLFGALWFLCFRTGILKKPSAWAVLVGSALLTVLAISFVQLPLQLVTAQLIGPNIFFMMPFLAAIPSVLYSGLIQEASKLVPVLVYRQRRKAEFSPRTGLLIGAVSGLGFGVFEAIWTHNAIFNAGWSWALVHSIGILGLAGFWERFFVVGFHIALCAFAGWGLARGNGWVFYLIVAVAHSALNYSAALIGNSVFSPVETEVYIAVVALVVIVLTLWLRWNIVEKDGTETDSTLDDVSQEAL